MFTAGRSSFLLTALVASMLVTAPLVYAADVNECSDTCTGGTCKVSAPNGVLRCCVNQGLCDGQGPITLSGGGDLDLDGHTIECACGKMFCSTSAQECNVDSDCPSSQTCTLDPQCDTCGYEAVVMTANGSQVKDTGDGGRITGLFGEVPSSGVVIDCDLKSSSSVQGITIDGFNLTAVYNCATVSENVIVGKGAALNGGVRTSGVANSDAIRDNHISNAGVAIILLEGTAGISVDHNLIQMNGEGVGISSSNTGAGLEVFSNVVLGDAGAFGATISGASGTSSKFSANYCDLATESCQDCVAEGFCDMPIAPFLFP
jgi:hypothetical protein